MTITLGASSAPAKLPPRYPSQNQDQSSHISRAGTESSGYSGQHSAKRYIVFSQNWHCCYRLNRAPITLLWQQKGCSRQQMHQLSCKHRLSRKQPLRYRKKLACPFLGPFPPGRSNAHAFTACLYSSSKTCVNTCSEHCRLLSTQERLAYSHARCATQR